MTEKRIGFRYFSKIQSETVDVWIIFDEVAGTSPAATHLSAKTSRLGSVGGVGGGQNAVSGSFFATGLNEDGARDEWACNDSTRRSDITDASIKAILQHHYLKERVEQRANDEELGKEEIKSPSRQKKPSKTVLIHREKGGKGKREESVEIGRITLQYPQQPLEKNEDSVLPTHCSVSHCKIFIPKKRVTLPISAIAFAKRPLGLDIEFRLGQNLGDDKIRKMAKRFFSQEESEQIEQFLSQIDEETNDPNTKTPLGEKKPPHMSENARQLFLRWWSVKEAYKKASGNFLLRALNTPVTMLEPVWCWQHFNLPVTQIIAMAQRCQHRLEIPANKVSSESFVGRGLGSGSVDDQSEKRHPQNSQGSSNAEDAKDAEAKLLSREKKGLDSHAEKRHPQNSQGSPNAEDAKDAKAKLLSREKKDMDSHGMGGVLSDTENMGELFLTALWSNDKENKGHAGKSKEKHSKDVKALETAGHQVTVDLHFTQRKLAF